MLCYAKSEKRRLFQDSGFTDNGCHDERMGRWIFVSKGLALFPLTIYSMSLDRFGVSKTNKKKHLHPDYLVIARRGEHGRIRRIPGHGVDTAFRMAFQSLNQSAVLFMPYVDL